MTENSDSSTPIATLPPISVKLRDGNFLIWRQQILATVIGYGLEPYLTGELQLPPQKETHRQDQLLAAWLQSSLSESAMIMVVGLTTAHDIWKAMETNFASQSKARVMQCKLLLQNIKKGSLSMRDYLNKIKSCCDLLGLSGCRVSEEDQILYLLGGLGSEYDPVMVAIISRSDGWRVEDVKAHLFLFESRLETEGLNLGNSRGNAGFKGGYGSKIICQLCQKPGHGAAECWNRFDQSFVSQAQQGRPHQH